ncbi:MAG: hypothetical protein RDU20_05685 [Desulfomonilaceae bacterium]|nr:hypothetical protein [Desulfomonilaceae bacterium]
MGRAGVCVLFYSWVLPGLIFPLHERLTRHTFWSDFLELKALQWRDRAELQARSLARLQGLLCHAYEHVPYYRDLFTTAGLLPTDIRSIGDLSLLPITTKADIRKSFPSRITLQNLKRERVQKKITSGSTGMPLEFYTDRERMDIVRSSYLFFWDWAGLSPWTPGIRVAIAPHFYGEQGIRASLRKSVRRTILGERTALLAGESLNVERLEREVRRVAGRGRYYIWAFPSYAARLAAQILERGSPCRRPPCVVISYAETLSPVDERLMGEAFGCRIVNHYGSLEIPFVAQTCPDNQGMLHTNSDRAVVRVVAEDGTDAKPGHKGRMVVTDLSNYVMPFINYDTGDIAFAAESCSCGRGLPAIERLEGRMVEVLRVPGGRTVSSGTLGHFLCSVCNAAPYLVEYQFVQTDPHEVTLKLVPTSLLSESFCEFLRLRLEEFLNGRMTVKIEIVEGIEREISGKRFIIKSSLVGSHDDAAG